MTILFFYHLDQFHIKHECAVGRNGIGYTLGAISEIAGYEERILRALLHELHTFGPSGDDTVEGECGGFTTVHAGVEHGTIEQVPRIICLLYTSDAADE